MQRKVYRSPLSRSIRQHVWDMTRGQCWYCGFRLNPFRDFVVEHMTPLSRGGTNDIENLVPSCCYCNQSKASRTVDEWRPFYADEQGLGSDPNEWLFWFEHGMEAADFPQVSVHLRYSRQKWRQIQITGYHCEESE